MTAVKEMAYAKVNLYLDVCAKRPDGFHDLNTVMHTLSLGDEVTVIMNGCSKRSIRLTVADNRFLPTDSKNLAYLAAQMFMDRAGINADISIKLRKRIPVGGGLGGGSADAAAVLRAMNRIFRRPFTDRALFEMSKDLGSDVPFCLIGGTAVCNDRGERIERVSTPPTLYSVIVNSGEHVSTPWAFKELDNAYNDFDGSIPSGGEERFAAFCSAIRDGRFDPSFAFNVFEEPILAKCRGALALKERLMAEGAYHAMMSGSGSSIFGLFSSRAEAETVEAKLRAEGVRAHFACSI